MDIGKRLKTAREAIGYTQKKAATESGIGESSISEFEHCAREPKFSQLSKLAEVYKKSIEFFLTDTPPVQDVMLWRIKPSSESERKKVEAKFRQLCEQYYNLEVCTGEMRTVELVKPDITTSAKFSYPQADSLAYKTRERLNLGETPSDTLKRRLEENWYVKIFYCEFQGSAISSVSRFGPSVLLNKKNVEWRRNYDLAHELFHILTWELFHATGTCSDEPSDKEESLANAFASALLLPEESLKERIDAYSDENSQITFDAIDNIVREFGVSWDALFWRLHRFYNKTEAETLKCITYAKKFMSSQPMRQSDEPDELPERYCHLARRMLREGRLSLIQFAKYMDISYRKAQEYLTDDEDITDEKISVSVA